MAGVGNVGINNKARKLKYGWVGINGVCRKLVQGWVGVNGVARTCWTCQIDAGIKVFTSSGTWVAPENMIIDIFCAGGGAGGSRGNGSGGGAGYTTTVKGYKVTKGTSYAVVVGAGGLSYTNNNGDINGGSGDGGASSFGGNICIANGGYSSSNTGHISCGGSGGGQQYGGKGGIDGANGSMGNGANDMTKYGQCLGQGTTTRAFGERDGTLYCTGGNSNDNNRTQMDHYPVAGANNTGDGGESGTYNGVDGANGGSGIVIIRWATQDV